MRQAGVLLHPTSLPGAQREGALGAEAFAFLDFLHESGMRVWQMLPVAPVHTDRSPYHALSLEAGGEHLIGLTALRAEGWLRGGGGARPCVRASLLRRVATRFLREADSNDRDDFATFSETTRDWLEPYCAFRVLRRRHRGAAWTDWPPLWRDGADDAYARLSRELPLALERERVVQYLFERQWRALRRQAAAAGVRLFGDLPFYPAPDSVDVWRHRRLFQLDHDGTPRATAGVPPDAFAQEGQGWGSALYDWEAMADDGFAWWRSRVRLQARRFDLLRLDHFRGFESYWSIPAGAGPAAGSWRPGPGAALFEALAAEAGGAVLVAEDLGAITPEVEALRRRFALPGTRVLQFAFDGGADNPHHPDRHGDDVVAYTGTHDNDTLRGWWQSLDADTRTRIGVSLGVEHEVLTEDLCGALLASPAPLAILPMQDLLRLDGRARMNVPGRALGNWRWQMRRGAVDGALIAGVRAMLRSAGRLHPPEHPTQTP